MGGRNIVTAHKVTCAVIPEREDDAVSSKFLVVAPEDRIVWVTTTRPGNKPDLSSEERKKAITQAGIQSLSRKMTEEELSAEQEADILELTDEQIDCRDRNNGHCEKYPRSAKCDCDHANNPDESTDKDDCYPGVLECWMLEDEVD